MAYIDVQRRKHGRLRRLTGADRVRRAERNVRRGRSIDQVVLDAVSVERKIKRLLHLETALAEAIVRRDSSLGLQQWLSARRVRGLQNQLKGVK